MTECKHCGKPECENKLLYISRPDKHSSESPDCPECDHSIDLHDEATCTYKITEKRVWTTSWYDICFCRRTFESLKWETL